MRIVERLTPFLGAWSGVDRLRLLPTGDDRESAATATVAVTGGEFVPGEVPYQAVEIVLDQRR